MNDVCIDTRGKQTMQPYYLDNDIVCWNNNSEEDSYFHDGKWIALDDMHDIAIRIITALEKGDNEIKNLRADGYFVTYHHADKNIKNGIRIEHIPYGEVTAVYFYRDFTLVRKYEKEYKKNKIFGKSVL